MTLILTHYFPVAIHISFSSSTYYSKVTTLEDPIGKVVIETRLVYKKSLVQNFTTPDYNLYRIDGRYFSVDNKGIVTLNKRLPYRRLYIFQISLLYTVTLVDNTTQSGYLTANARVQAIGMNRLFGSCLVLSFYCLAGPVRFDNSTYIITIPINIQPYERVHDFSQHIVVNRSAFRSVYFEFDYVYNYYFTMEASTGILYVRRALYPTTFSVRIEIEYDITLKNGTVVSDDEYVYARITTIGE